MSKRDYPQSLWKKLRIRTRRRMRVGFANLGYVVRCLNYSVSKELESFIKGKTDMYFRCFIR